MPKNKPDKEYYALFLLIFVLVFAFGVVVGSYACGVGSGGATGSVTFTVSDSSGTTADAGVSVEFNGVTKQTDANGEVKFTNVDVGTYDKSDVDVDNYDIKSLNGENVNSDDGDFTVTDGQNTDVPIVVKGTLGGGDGPAKLSESNRNQPKDLYRGSTYNTNTQSRALWATAGALWTH